MAALYSCQKNITNEPTPREEQISASSNRPDDPGFAENDMVLYWNDKTSLVLGRPMPQPRRARLFAITQIAVHDALNAIKPKFHRYAFKDYREQFANPDAAVASAAYWVIKGLNIQATFPIDTWYNESLSLIPDSESKELGKALGKLSADAIIANRSNDGLTLEISSSPLPPDGDDPGEYRSTLPYSNPVLNLPHTKLHTNWGIVLRPFVITSNSQFRPEGPYAVNTGSYTQDFNEVKSKGALVGHTRTPEESALLLFWSDIRPSLIWNTVARNVLNTKKLDAWKTARLFALMHTAIADGNNAVLEAKYHFYYWRPETAIRLGDSDNNPNTTGDPAWLPSIVAVPNANPLMNTYTPPIPDYPSSFSMHGGAAVEILKLFFETDNISFDLASPVPQTLPRHFSSLSQASAENSVAWIYAGFYFRKAVLDGEEHGRQIANYVFNNSFDEE
jgi:hypothetical protein